MFAIGWQQAKTTRIGYRLKLQSADPRAALDWLGGHSTRLPSPTGTNARRWRACVAGRECLAVSQRTGQRRSPPVGHEGSVGTPLPSRPHQAHFAFGLFPGWPLRLCPATRGSRQPVRIGAVGFGGWRIGRPIREAISECVRVSQVRPRALFFPWHRLDQSPQDLVHGIGHSEDFGHVGVQRDDEAGWVNSRREPVGLRFAVVEPILGSQLVARAVLLPYDPVPSS